MTFRPPPRPLVVTRTGEEGPDRDLLSEADRVIRDGGRAEALAGGALYADGPPVQSKAPLVARSNA
jgi:hypothetical protein